MKFITLALAAATGLATTAQACIRVHAQFNQNFISGDVMQVQIWDNEHYVCQTGGSKRSTPQDHVWRVGCSGSNSPYSYDVELSWNGRSGKVTHKVREGDVWSANLQVKDTDSERACLRPNENGGCRTYEQFHETCLNDNFGNCGSYSCPMCDFRGWCPK